jgi:hypothetical protein
MACFAARKAWRQFARAGDRGFGCRPVAENLPAWASAKSGSCAMEAAKASAAPMSAANSASTPTT